MQYSIKCSTQKLYLYVLEKITFYDANENISCITEM